MLPSTAGAERQVSRRVGVVLLIVAVAALAAPTIYLLRAPQVQASKPLRPQPLPVTAVPSATGTVVTTTAAPVNRIEYIPEPSEDEEKILKALDEPIKLDLDESTLSDAVEYIQQKTGANINLDERALGDAAIDPSVPVTFHSGKRALRSSLRQILGRLDLTFFVADDALTITTEEKAESIFITRTYPVADLVASDVILPYPTTTPGEDGATTETATTDEKPNPKRKPPTAKNAYERLAQVVQSTVAPDSWNDDGGRGAVAIVPESKSLVISQTHSGHDAVLQLLRSLRAARIIAEDPNAIPPRRTRATKQGEASATSPDAPATQAELPGGIPVNPADDPFTAVPERPKAEQQAPDVDKSKTAPADDPFNPANVKPKVEENLPATTPEELFADPFRPVSSRTSPAKRLVNKELDPVTGQISWPTILQDSRYAKQVGELNENFKARATLTGNLDAVRYSQIRASCDRLQLLLHEHMAEYGSRDYLAAIRFIDGLRMEASPRER